MSPRRNRVTPLAAIEPLELRGAWTGNRGILHRGEEIVRFHAHSHWLTCALRFRERWHEQWQPHHFTWLYFHDEAVAFAAGHRPCAECRRSDYEAFRAAWAAAPGRELPSAAAIDRQLHAERLLPRRRRRLHELPWRELPDGAFVLRDDVPALVTGARLVPWTAAGYGEPSRRPRRGHALALTPPSTLAAFAAGYRPQIDAGAQSSQ